MNTLSTVQFTAFIGIDWADAKHDVCVQAAATLEGTRESSPSGHTP